MAWLEPLERHGPASPQRVWSRSSAERKGWAGLRVSSMPSSCSKPRPWPSSTGSGTTRSRYSQSRRLLHRDLTRSFGTGGTARSPTRAGSCFKPPTSRMCRAPGVSRLRSGAAGVRRTRSDPFRSGSPILLTSVSPPRHSRRCTTRTGARLRSGSRRHRRGVQATRRSSPAGSRWPKSGQAEAPPQHSAS